MPLAQCPGQPWVAKTLLTAASSHSRPHERTATCESIDHPIHVVTDRSRHGTGVPVRPTERGLKPRTRDDGGGGKVRPDLIGLSAWLRLPRLLGEASFATAEQPAASAKRSEKGRACGRRHKTETATGVLYLQKMSRWASLFRKCAKGRHYHARSLLSGLKQLA